MREAVETQAEPATTSPALRSAPIPGAATYDLSAVLLIRWRSFCERCRARDGRAPGRMSGLDGMRQARRSNLLSITKKNRRSFRRFRYQDWLEDYFFRRTANSRPKAPKPQTAMVEGSGTATKRRLSR